MRLHLATFGWLVAGMGTAFAASEQPVYTFQGGNDGALPASGLIADAKGNLYGTTSSGGAGQNGVVFELSPPAGGATQWTETVLYAFTGGSDGGAPAGRLTPGKKGVLYGTATQGGAGGGTVFSLTPPKKAGGAWTQTVLYAFTGGSDGGAPRCALISDRAGNIYGTATQGGTGAGVVFRLSPPVDGTTWVESVLHAFTGGTDGAAPYGGLLLGGDGALYGTASAAGQYNAGTLYRLVAANEVSWNFQLLYGFQGGTDGAAPHDGVTAGPNGSFYGTTSGAAGSVGTVFQLVPPAGSGSWTETPLTAFTGAAGQGPWATVTSTKGTLYGTAVGTSAAPYGEIFQLTQNNGAWTPSVLHAFQGGADGQSPYSTVLVGAHGVAYGTAAGAGGQGASQGVVWQLSGGARLRR